MKTIFAPQVYKIEDKCCIPFIDDQEIESILLENSTPSVSQIEDVITKSLNKNRLSMQEVAMLISADSSEMIEKIKMAAETLKRNVYGNRIVLFAPLYIGNKCSNNCLYCGFRATNQEAVRQTLTDRQIVEETQSLLDSGHKRLVLVYGEHAKYNAQYIADTVKTVYSVKKGNGEIRRVNINAAPFDVEDFRIIKKAGIGTYQIFQETYDRKVYASFHLSGRKSDYDYRLTALDRAMEAGIDDVGIGVLFGLGDWKKEVLSLVRHVNHLEACYNVGPHTISFPRIKEAQGVDKNMFDAVSDDDFVRLVAILRLAVPYAGMILTAREDEHVRRKVIRFGVSQIDGGTKIDIGGYSNNKNKEHSVNIDKEQFTINDDRTLSQVIESLIDDGYIPSFCTSCYRKGRTGEHFMEFCVPGFIKRFCTPNAVITFAEFLEDYADNSLKDKGYALINEEILYMDNNTKNVVIEKLNNIKNNKRDECL